MTATARRVVRALVRGLAIAALIAAALLVFLWWQGDRDLAYVLRVLVHRDAGTDDYRWKRAAVVPAAPAPVPWRSAPACDRFVDGETAAWLDRGGALAFVVVRDGALACEWYGHGGARDRPAAAFSISKTVTALVVARAADARAISLAEPITNRLPELARRDRRFDAIALADLIDMRSGLAFSDDDGFPWVNRDPALVYYASDLAGTAIGHARVASPPGPFVYNDYAPNLVGLALERATGTRLAAATAALWAELGAEDAARWSVDDRGFAWHESGFVVSARDLARIGQLVLDGGVVANRAVAPAAWVERSRDPAGRAPVVDFGGTALGYRNGWWIAGDDLVAMGRHGQVMVVAPATRTVIVRLGLDGHAETNVAIANRLRALAARL